MSLCVCALCSMIDADYDTQQTQLDNVPNPRLESARARTLGSIHDATNKKRENTKRIDCKP